MRCYVIFVYMLTCAMAAGANMVSGIVRSQRSQEPLPGVAVNAAIVGSDSVVTTSTDAAGYYQITVVTPETLAFSFVLAGCCDYLDTIVVEDENDDEILSPLLRDPVFFCTRTSIHGMTWPGHDVRDTFFVTNIDGLCDLEFTISDTSEWLSALPEAGVIPPDSTETIAVLLDEDYLEPGVALQSVLHIEHNGLSSPYIIPVEFFYVDSWVADDPDVTPASFDVAAYPNPFNAVTTISFSLPAAHNVDLEIFDTIGRRVASPVHEVMHAGGHRAVFDGSALPSGIYFARLLAGEMRLTQKLLLLK